MDPARQRFRRLSEQIPGSASQDQKTRLFFGGKSPVDKDAKRFEKIGMVLNFIDDDGSAQRLERQVRLIQPGQILGIFEIKIMDDPSTSALTVGELPRQRRFTALAGP